MSVSQVTVLAVQAPGDARKALAGFGIPTPTVLIAVADGNLPTWAARQGWMSRADAAEARPGTITNTAWQAQLCLANPGRVLAFRGDGRPDPDRSAADLGPVTPG